MKFQLLIYFILISLTGLGQQKKQIIFPPPVLSMHYPDFIDACDILNHKKESVYTRFIYSGTEDYWRLTPDCGCKSIDAYLEIPQNLKVEPRFLKLLKQVHRRSWTAYLIIDIIGTFEDKKQSGYGHSGSNDSKFTAEHIVDMQMVHKNFKPTM